MRTSKHQDVDVDCAAGGARSAFSHPSKDRIGLHGTVPLRDAGFQDFSQCTICIYGSYTGPLNIQQVELTSSKRPPR